MLSRVATLQPNTAEPARDRESLDVCSCNVCRVFVYVMRVAYVIVWGVCVYTWYMRMRVVYGCTCEHV